MDFFAQSFFIGKPAITEQNCPDQKGRVFIVTGGYAGVGFELSRILFARNATVYVAGRSEAKAKDAMAKIKSDVVDSGGSIAFLHVDLADLTTIKPAVEKFTGLEKRLDVLVNNAAVMDPPPSLPSTAQSHDLQFGTNCLGPYLLTKLLLPVLSKTALSSAPGSVRVAWAGSVGIDAASPSPGGMKLDAQGKPEIGGMGQVVVYAATKAGNLFMAREMARRTPENGVVHVTFNPGNLRSELHRHWKGVQLWLTDSILLYPPVLGAYTELWAAVAPEITAEKSGAYVWPWGKFGGVRADVEASTKSQAEGGTGLGERFTAWCEEETAPFA